MSSTIRQDTRLVPLTDRAGHVEIQATPLTRLNYHDGMLLRSAALQREQQYVRNLSQLSNQAGGAGIVHGFDCSAAGGSLTIGPGLAIDPSGRVLRLVQPVTVGIDELIRKSRSDQPAAAAGEPAGAVPAEFVRCQVRPGEDQPPTLQLRKLYLITVGHAEAACGQSEIYADPCRAACESSSAYAYLLEGVIIRAVPLDVPLAWPQYPELTGKHLRSLVASAWFAWERQRFGPLISRAGLESNAWCQGALELAGGDLAIGLLATGSSPFLDIWTVRRERMESPPRHYWAGRLAMRPWNVFLAQVLQFQCQLRHCLSEPPADAGDDPCRQIVDEAARLMAELLPQYAAISERLAGAAERSAGGSASAQIEAGLQRMRAIQSRLQSLPQGATGAQWLIECGIVELPSAGYLPVVPGSPLSVNQQVRAMLGEGVDLRFCAVRPDFVPHALEAAQHMERISLLAGLHQPDQRPQVDVLVPDGQVQAAVNQPPGELHELTLDLLTPAWRLLVLTINGATAGNGDAGAGAELLQALLQEGPQFTFRGAARSERTAANGLAWCGAGVFESPVPVTPAFTLVELLRNSAVWLAMETTRDPLAMQRLESTRVSGELALLFSQIVIRLRLLGDLQVVETPARGSEARVAARLSGTLVVTAAGNTPPTSLPDPIAISEPVIIQRKSDGAGGPVIELTLPSPGLLGPARKLAAFRSVRTTSATGEMLDDGSLQAFGQPVPAAPSFTISPAIPLYRAAQRRNPGVASPSHSLHAASLTAIRAIAAVLAEPQFEELATRRLFPPTPPSSEDLVIRATNDWVLFHRRREKVCSPPEELPPQLAVRRFRLVAIPLRDAAELKQFAEALRVNQPGAIDPKRTRIVSVVEFAAGIHTLHSEPDDVRAQWRAGFAEPVQIVLGAVATVGAARDEGQQLARARLGHLTGVLATDTPLLADASLEYLDALPDGSGISVEPYDGVLILATLPTAPPPQTETVCNEVFVASVLEGRLDAFIKQIESEGLARALGGRDSRGSVLFELPAHTPRPESLDEMVSRWKRDFPANTQRPDTFLAVSPGGTDSNLLAGHRQQSETLRQALGGRGSAIQVQSRPDTGFPSNCPAATVAIITRIG
ncbi:MAG: hypothetical protein J5I93_01975 [Pirellulaceae bacterium]|nr:hypothetical protein [Pirellulaceae bacterium]